MKVFLTIWISAVLIQEVIPGTLVRLPRQSSKQPSLVETEYEAKYEQTGQHGNETSGLLSGKHEILHNNCADNWNAFADKCAALVKDLVASLAGSVSSRPGDATKLQLQIKNTFRHFDSTHNCTCLNKSGKTGLSCLFNNITINTIAPTANNDRNCTVANNEDGHSCKGNNDSGLREGVVGLESNGGDDGNGSTDAHDNKLGTVNSHPSGVSRKPNTALDHAKNLGFSPENEDSEAGSSSRRQAEYPQVSWQPGNKTRHSQSNQGRSNNISRSPYPFIVTPQPNSAHGSPTLATYSGGNNLPNGENGFGSDGQTNSNGENHIPLRIQTLPATNAYKSEPASDSHYKAGAEVPTTGSHNSANPTVAGEPSTFNDHYQKVPAIPTPSGHNSMSGYSHPKPPITDDGYDSKPVPVQPTTDDLYEPKFPANNSPNSNSYSNKPQPILSTPTSYTPENHQSSDSHALSKNQHNSPVAKRIQSVPSVTPEDSGLDSISGTPNTKPVLTIGKPEVFRAQKDKTVRDPVINSDSNFPESRGPESQWGTTNPLPTSPNPNPSSAHVKRGGHAIPEVLPASIIDEVEKTTNKFSDAITVPLVHIPPSEYVKPALPEADNHKSEDPSDAAHTLHNPSDRLAVIPSSHTENFDPVEGNGSENVNDNSQRSAPATVYPAYTTTTISPLGYHNHVKPEENSENSNSNTYPDNEDDEDCEEYTDSDPVTNAGTGNHPTIPVAVSPEQRVPTVLDSVPQLVHGDVPVPHDGDENKGSSNDPISESNSSSNTGTGNDAIPPVEVSPAQAVSTVSDPVVQALQGDVPVPHDDDENKGSSNDPISDSNSISNTGTGDDSIAPVEVSQVKSVSTVSDPVAHTVEGSIPAPDDDEDCDENEESSNDATIPVAESPEQHAPMVSDSAVQRVEEGKVPGSGNDAENMGFNKYPNGHSSNTRTGNDPTILVTVSPVQHVPTVSDPVVEGNHPAPDDGGETTGSGNYPNGLSGTSSVAASQVNPVSTASDPVVQVHENVPIPGDEEDRDENKELRKGTTTPIAVSPEQRASTVSDPVVQTVQGNVPAFDNGSENTGSSNDPISASDSSSNTRTGNEPTIPLAVSPVQHAPTVSDPAVHVVEGNVPGSDVGSENMRSGNDPIIPVAMSPEQHVPSVSDPVVQVPHGKVSALDNGGENTGSSNDPISAYDNSPNDPTIPLAVSPVEPLSTVAEPAGQSLQSGGSPQSNTGSGVGAVQNVNSQSSAPNVTPLPDADHTPISTSSEGQSGNSGNEDPAFHEPTTFQTTAGDPTSPQSILIPTESTRLLTPASTGSQSSVGHSVSPHSNENDDDDEDEEDCCSCESCTDEITDPKQYKENACKNLEEARRELKAIFDKIKKKLKCGRKCGVAEKKNAPNQSHFLHTPS